VHFEVREKCPCTFKKSFLEIILASTKAEQLLFVFREAKSIVAVNFSERQLQRLLKVFFYCSI